MGNHSLMKELGSRAADFSLPDPSGRVYSLRDFASSRGLLVAFICNHCPFVQHMIGGFAGFAREYAPKSVAVVAISSNDVLSHPDDAPPLMAEFARKHRFVFPYLYDESQRVALAYQAVCTPDFFLYDAQQRLVYRGQFDASRPYTEWDVKAGRTPNRAPNDGADMRKAADALLAGGPPLAEQRPAMGCSIKWRAENEPAWS
jgi:peroxiredoxin